MIALILLLLLTLTTCSLALSKSKKIGVTSSILALGLFLVTGCGWLPSWLLSSLQASTVRPSQVVWGRRNAIVVLGFGTVRPAGASKVRVQPGILAYSRLLKAATLYRQCRQDHQSCVLILSGGDATRTGLPEAVTYQKGLVTLGVDPHDIQLEPQSLNTYQNAQYTSALLTKGRFDRIWLVTSAFHLKRALLYFTHFKVYPMPVPADYMRAPLSSVPLGYNIALADFAIHEYMGIIQYYFYNFMDWNKVHSVRSEV